MMLAKFSHPSGHIVNHRAVSRQRDRQVQALQLVERAKIAAQRIWIEAGPQRNIRGYVRKNLMVSGQTSRFT